MMVGLKRISTAFGLVVTLASLAAGQEPAVSQNQSTANAVAGTLRASRNLAGYRIEIMTREGLVTLRGAVETPAQKAEAIARARYVAGVRGVVDELRVSNDVAVSTVRYQPGGGMVSAPGRRVRRRHDQRRRHLRCRLGPELRRQPGSGGPGGHAGGLASRPTRIPELRVAQLRAVPEFLRCRLSNGLPLASLAEHRTVLALSRSSA